MSRFVLTAQLQLQAPNNVAQIVRQIQSQLNGVTVNLQVQGAPQAQRQIQQVTQNVQQATTAAERMGRAFAVSVRRFAAFSIATRAVGLFTSTLGDAVQTAINFERQLIKVSQVTGKSVGQLRDLTNEITRLATGLGVSSDSLLEVSTVLAQAGLSANDTKVALNALAKAALAPNFDSITETAEGAIAILAQFQEGVGALEKQLGSINAVAGAFAVEASDLIDVVRRTGGVFKSSGGSLNELLALFTSVRATTRESAESIGTGLRTIFTRIQRPKTIEFLKQFGVELVDLEGKFVGPYEAIRRLSEGLAGLGDRDITFIKIAEELGGFRQIGKVLPLLQQFATAEAALNVATKANNSLTADAVSAQAALAVRITKVKEEFLALVRSITETSTFQVFANTALSLASALIKLADSIKPLLPLLGAMAAIKLARGVGGFLGGVGGGLSSGRTFNRGGKVHKFARGGMVPGTGNSDTVPAMLQPGEFVIRKSSVNRLGASTLAAMNENKFNDGIKVTKAKSQGMSTKDVLAASRASVATPRFSRESSVGIATTSFLPSPVTGSISIDRDSDIINQVIGGVGVSLSKRFGQKEALSAVQNIFKGKKTFTYSATAEGVGRDEEQQFANIINQSISTAIDQAAATFATQVMRTSAPSPIRKTAAFYETLDQGFRGQLFENVISALSGKPLAGQDSRRPFDFTRGLGQFKNIYGNLPMDYVDAKITSGAAGVGKANSFTTPGEEGLKSKIAGQMALELMPFIGSMVKKNAGGSVGTDTVPALLTPGEFVVNRASAQRIGYGNLNRMNKVGRYANGGVVQNFNNGTTMVGARPARSRSNPSTVAFVSLQDLNQQADTLAKTTQQVNQAQQQQRKSIGETVAANKMFAASMTVGLLQGFLPALDENAGALTRMSHSLLDMVGTLVTVGFALEAFNIQLQTKALFDLLTGAKSLTGTFKSLRSSQPIKALKAGFNRGVSGSAIQANTTTGRIGQFAGSALTRGKDLAASAGSRLSAARSNLNVAGSRLNAAGSNVSKGFSAGFNRPDVNTFKTIFGSSRGIGAKVSGALGRTLSLGGTALSKIPGVGILGRAASTVGGAASRGGSQFLKGATATFNNPSKAIIGSGASASAQAGGLVGKGLANLNKLGIAALGVGIAFNAITSVVDAFTDYQGRANKAIQDGNVEKAKSNSVEAAGADVFNSLGSAIIGASALFGPLGLAVGAATAGALKLGSELPVIGPAIKKLAIGFGAFFGGNTLNSIETLAAAQAQAVKTQKEFEIGQKNATSALEDLQNGTIGLAEALSRIGNIESAKNAAQSANEKAVKANLENKSEIGSGAILRNLGAYLGGGLFGMETAATRNKRIDTENAGLIRQNAETERKAFDISRPVVNESIKRGLAQGMTTDQINEQLGSNSSGAMRNRMSTLLKKASAADSKGETETANAFREQAKVLEEQAKELDKSFENLAKEAERNRKAFAAMNLDMQNVQGAASAAVLGINNYVAAQQAGNIPLQQSLATLEASVTSAAQGISDADFESALGDAEATLRRFGANDQQVNKFKQNLKSVNEVQKNSATLFAQTKSELQGRLTAGSAEDRRNAFSDILGKNLASQKDAAGNRLYDDETIKRLQDQIGTLTEDQINELGKGNFSVFEQVMGDLGKKVLDQVNGPLNDAIKIQEQLNQLTKNRIELERNLMSAQQEALNVQMEARDIEAKYGGKAVTPGERRANIVAQANVQATGINGVDKLKTGSAAEIAARTGQIGARQKEIADIRSKAAAGDKDAQAKLAGEAGLKLEEEERRLNEAAKSQIQTTRDLIKVKEEELKTIQEKNRLEKQSMESLINGDIEKFFEQQAAVGATAAIATGNQDLMNAFGASALAGAYSDIQRQQEAGVQEIYGRRIAGPGGLGEQAASAALAARGVQNPAAAQMLAGTTPEEEDVKSDIRALAATMGPTADLQVQSAQDQLKAAEIQLRAAEKQAQKAVRQTEARQPAPDVAEAKNKGGMVYASRGIFVPRGTDTVPAMLTPGEFVVRREAVNRGNNLQLLQAMNNGMSGSAGAAAGVQNFARGGKVQYLAGGGLLNGIVQNILGTDVISMLTKALTAFSSQMSETIKSLQDTKFKITLDSTNVNVNISGNAGLLSGLTQEVRNEIAKIVSDKIKNTSVGSGGRLVENMGTLPTGR